MSRLTYSVLCICVCLCVCLCVCGGMYVYVQDLKSEKQRAQMGSARAILEKSTMMLLTSCKVHCLSSLKEYDFKIAVNNSN